MPLDTSPKNGRCRWCFSLISVWLLEPVAIPTRADVDEEVRVSGVACRCDTTRVLRGTHSQ